MLTRARRRRPAWLPRLSLRGAMLLLAGVTLAVLGVVLARRDLLFVGALLLLLPAIALAFVCIRPVRVQVGRAVFPAVVAAGDTALVSLRVRNLSPRPVWGARWRDTVSGSIPAPERRDLPTLDRHAPGPDGGPDSARVDYRVLAPGRGIYFSGPLQLGRSDPFGLAFNERPVGAPHDFIVTPRVTALPGSGMAVVSGDGASREALRNISPNADELIAREYRPGDPLRRVNWRATARHGEIMVRQEEQRSNPEARLVLDTTPPNIERTDRTERAFELAIEIAASVGVHLIGSGFRVQLVETGASQIAPGVERAAGGLRGDAPVYFDVGGERPLLEALAIVQPVSAAATDDGGRGRPGLVPSPTIAVLVETDARGLADLRVLRERSNPAIAFVLDTMSSESVATLRDAGWRCIPVLTDAEIPEAWDSALRDRADRESSRDD